MVEGYEFSIPITLKGGREGEKVGKQIGEKIAAQLNKSFRAINIGGTKSGGGASMLGVTKGLKGVATKMGIVGAAIAATVGILAKASPYLKGILSIFGRAFMIFFRPFGDFLATLLRPMAILLMKMAVAFLKWMRPLGASAREAMEGVPQFGEVNNALGNFAIGIGNWALQIGAAIGDFIFNIGKGAFDLGTKIGEWFYNAVIVPVANFIKNAIRNLFGGGQTGKVGGSAGVGSVVGAVTGGATTGAVGSVVGAITGGAGGSGGAGGTSILGSIGKVIGGIMEHNKRIQTGSLIGSVISIIGNLFGKGQVGIPSVPSDGLYQLHKGEEVISRTKTMNNKSMVLNQNLNFSGPVSNDLDVDEIVRRAGRITEMELKKRGIM